MSEPDRDDGPVGKHSNLIPFAFKPGQSGNPSGRPKGARSRVNEKFLVALERIWDEQGEAMMAKAAVAEPMQFVKMVSGLQPTKIEQSLEVSLFKEEYADMAEFAKAYNLARTMIGVAPPEIEGEFEMVEEAEAEHED